jgi:hypothetical protein
MQLRRNLDDAVRVLSRAHPRDRARPSPVTPGRENRRKNANDKSAHRRRRSNLNPADPKKCLRNLGARIVLACAHTAPSKKIAQ